MKVETTTLEQVRETIAPVKPCSIVQLRRYLRRFDIKPIGPWRQRPERYPADTAGKILAQLGFEPNGHHTLRERLVSLPRLRSERRKAQKARGK